MVSLEWPPVYDENYMPRPKQRYWFPNLETIKPEEREKLIVKKLRAQMRYVYERAALYHKKWKNAEIHPDDIKSISDFQKVPFIKKEDLIKDQAENPPFGSYLCVQPDKIYSIFGTSGTTGLPTVFGISRGDWSRISNAHARIMWGFGLRPWDRVIICSVLSLYMGGWGALAGVQRLRAIAFPFGAGISGQTRMAVHWIKRIKPTVFYGTPSYALYLSEVAREEGIEPGKDFSFRIMFFSGEPGASLPTVKRKIEETFNCKCIDTGSTAEMTPWMTNAECEYRSGMHLWLDLVYTEIVDPETGELVNAGEEGVPVYTHLERNSQPIIKFFSGDITTWTDEPCGCGRTYPRLPKGVYGRIDDRIIIKDLKIMPSAIQEALDRVPGYNGEHRIILTREKWMDILIIQAEYNKKVEKLAKTNPSVLGELKRKMIGSVKITCGLTPVIELVPHGTFDRSQFKAKRIVDKRELYEELRKMVTKYQGEEY